MLARKAPLLRLAASAASVGGVQGVGGALALGRVLADEHAAVGLPRRHGNADDVLVAGLPAAGLGEEGPFQGHRPAVEERGQAVGDAGPDHAGQLGQLAAEEGLGSQPAPGEMGQVPAVDVGHPALGVEGHDRQRQLVDQGAVAGLAGRQFGEGPPVGA